MAATDLGAHQRVVAVGASAGGVGALIRLAAGLPRDLGYAVMVVLHRPTKAPPSQLARILDRAGPLPAVWAAHRDLIETGLLRRCKSFQHRDSEQNRQNPGVNRKKSLASKKAFHL